MRNDKTKKILISVIALVIAVSLIAALYITAAAEVNIAPPAMAGTQSSDNGASATAGDPDNDYKSGATMVESAGTADGSVGNSRRYIEQRGYERDSAWTRISNEAQLQSWLRNDQGRNAYLDADIPSFIWFRENVDKNEGDTRTNSYCSAPDDSIINRGRILDGCGYKVNINPQRPYRSGNFIWRDSGAPGRQYSHYYSMFVNKMYGVLKNMNFAFSGTQQVEISVGGDHKYWGLVIGLLGEDEVDGTIAQADAALVENLYIELNDLHYEFQSKTRMGSAYGQSTFYGALTGDMTRGTVRNVTVNNNPSQISTANKILHRGAESGGGLIYPTKEFFIGGIIGKMGTGAGKTVEAYNLATLGKGIYHGIVGNDGTCRIGSVIGRWWDAGVTEISRLYGMYAEYFPDKGEGMGDDELYLFVGYVSEGSIKKWNNYNFSKVQENTRYPQVNLTKLDEDIDFEFDKADVLADRMTNADYVAQHSNMLVRKQNRPSNKIYWDIGFTKISGAQSNSYDLYHQAASTNNESYIKLPCAYEGEAGYVGNTLYINYGEHLKLTGLPSTNTTYDGQRKSIDLNSVTFVDSFTSAQVTIDTGKLRPVYDSNIERDAPYVSRDFPYYRVNMVSSDKPNHYSYFDAANRKIAMLDNSIYSEIKIDRANALHDGGKIDGNNYDGSWSAVPITYTVTVENVVEARGYRIEYSRADVGSDIWSAWKDDGEDNNISLSELNNATFKYRFRLSVLDDEGAWQAVTNASESVSYRFDDSVPITSNISTYIEGTWSDTTVTVAPTALGKEAPVSVEVSHDGGMSWGPADEQVYDPVIGTINGFFITEEGISTYWLRGTSEAKKADGTKLTSEPKEFQVKIDKTDYTITHEVKMAGDNTDVLDTVTLAFTSGRETFKRSEKPEFTLNAALDELGYMIVSVNGEALDTPISEYRGRYLFNEELGQGAEQEPIKVLVKKKVKAQLPTLTSMDYGRLSDQEIFARALEGITIEGLIDGDELAEIGVTVRHNGENISAAGYMAVGEHELIAEAAENGNYIINVINTSIVITPKFISLSYNEHARYLRDDWWGSDAAEQLAMLEITPTDGEVLAGDTVNVIGFKYLLAEDQELNAYGVYRLIGTIDNLNYTVEGDGQSEGSVKLAMYAYGSEELDGAGAYMLETADDLAELAQYPEMLTENFVLKADIDMSLIGGQIILGELTGIFDGQGFALKNLNVVSFGAKQVGLFTSVDGGTVRNIKFINIDFNMYFAAGSDAVNCGIITAVANNATIEHVVLEGNIDITAECNELYFGAIAGQASGTVISDVELIGRANIVTSGKVIAGGNVGQSTQTTINGVTSFIMINLNSNDLSSELGYVVGNDTPADGTAASYDYVEYLKDAIINNGTALADDDKVTDDGELMATGHDYAYFMGRSQNDFNDRLVAMISPNHYDNAFGGTAEDSAFEISTYDELLLTLVYPYATFKLTDDIICYAENAFNQQEFFGNLYADGHKIYDYLGSEIEFRSADANGGSAE